MLTKTNKKYQKFISPFRIIALLPIIFCLLAFNAFAQKTDKNKNLPLWQSYREISIGTTAAQVTEKLGKPKSEDDQGFFYIFSETETAQFLLDENKKVKTISVIYSAEHATPPAFADVFGQSAKAEPKPDGSIFKMVRFEDAGYWVSYNRMAGEKAMVIVMIQKL